MKDKSKQQRLFRRCRSSIKLDCLDVELESLKKITPMSIEFLQYEFNYFALP